MARAAPTVAPRTGRKLVRKKGMRVERRAPLRRPDAPVEQVVDEAHDLVQEHAGGGLGEARRRRARDARRSPALRFAPRSWGRAAGPANSARARASDSRDRTRSGLSISITEVSHHPPCASSAKARRSSADEGAPERGLDPRQHAAAEELPREVAGQGRHGDPVPARDGGRGLLERDEMTGSRRGRWRSGRSGSPSGPAPPRSRPRRRARRAAGY